MFAKIKSTIAGHISSIPGWSTKRKIVVIESDDWGMVRMKSKAAYEAILKKGYPVDQCLYNRNDCLESNDDLERLLEVLNSLRDKNGHPAILTFNNIVANPDFEKIRIANYQAYFYETFPETLKRYPNHNRVMELYKTGIQNRLLKPQFHGREHINVINWLEALKNKEKEAVDVFDYGMFTVFRGTNSSCKKEFLDAMAAYSDVHSVFIEKAIKEGMVIFKDLWKINSETVIAPCYTWSAETESVFKVNGIIGLQSGRAQKIPIKDGSGYTITRRFSGQKNKHGQIYTVRNVEFEPSSDLSKDWIDSCLKEINIAFNWRKPAIISTHRVNFIGGINPANSSKNLILFKELLNRIIKRWPDVEFLSSDELVKVITKN